uniref:WD_REPEATS_REGION domain-containing protein n=1 Tax=Parastrongyloides trichosuri TaxID=131310 RepID=A0A0N5A2T4_PARTI
MPTITSISFNKNIPESFSFTTAKEYVYQVPIVKNENDIKIFNKKLESNSNKINNLLSSNDIITNVISYPPDGTLECLLVQKGNTSSEIIVTAMGNQLVDRYKLLNYCDTIVWNHNEIDNDKIGCKQLNSIHIYNVEIGAITFNFICNNITDFRWDLKNHNYIYACDFNGIITLQDLRVIKGIKFGEIIDKSNKCQIELIDNYALVTSMKEVCKIYDVRNQKIIKNFKLNSSNVSKDLLPPYNSYINCPIFKVHNMNNNYLYLYKHGTDFYAKKMSKSLDDIGDEDIYIQTRHIYDINDFDIHSTLNYLTSVRDGIDVYNLGELFKK